MPPLLFFSPPAPPGPETPPPCPCCGAPVVPLRGQCRCSRCSFTLCEECDSGAASVDDE